MENGVLPQGTLESREDFKDNPRDQYRYWLTELKSAERNFKAFVKQGNRIIERYLATNPVGGRQIATGYAEETKAFKLNLFYSNTTTLISTMFGQIPKVEVTRRFADPNDDVGRVAALLMERLLNADIAENGKEIDVVLRTDLEDRLTAGLGAARIRYKADFGTLPDDENNTEYLVKEKSHVEYVHWRDIRWGWARTFADVPWIGFRAYLTKDEVKKRFGDEPAEKLQYKVQMSMKEEDDPTTSDDNADAWKKAEIWEIWDKSKRQVVWVSEGYDRVLETKDDPLKLSNFWPCPPPYIANCTSTLYIPTADYHLAQDLYNEIDKLQTRISIITDAVKVVGVYDAQSADIARMLKEGVDNDLIPVSNWALFAEKGGIQGQIDWFPIQDVVQALLQLVQMRDQTIGLLQQITGMSDLMRGQLDNQYEGVGQSQLKAQMGSVRLQALQEEFAQYVTDLMQVQAEVISRHYEPQTILRCANAMVDFAKLKMERSDFINALATFMQSMAPMMQQNPETTPYLLQLLKWGLAGYKGANEIEGVLDKAIDESIRKQQEAAQQPPEPSPEEKVTQMEQQFQMQLEQMKAQSEMAKIQAKAQADIAVRNNDAQADSQTMIQEHMAEMERQQVEMVTALTEIKAKMNADIQKEIAQSQANMMQTAVAAQGEIEKDRQEAEIAIQEEAVKTELKIDEHEAQATAKIREAKAKPTPKPAEKKGETD